MSGYFFAGFLYGAHQAAPAKYVRWRPLLAVSTDRFGSLADRRQPANSCRSVDHQKQFEELRPRRTPLSVEALDERSHRPKQTRFRNEARYFANMPFGVMPFRNGSMNACSKSGCVMIAVCDVAGRIARREADNGFPVSPIAPPPSRWNIATACSRVIPSASPAMISTGDLIPFTSAAHAIGSFWSAMTFLTSSGKPLGLGASFLYSAANGVWTIISTVSFGMDALNSGCQPSKSYAPEPKTSLPTFAGWRIASCSPAIAPIE